MAAERRRDVSIVIPAFNEEGGIEASLETVKAALEPLERGWEIVVVDDGSTDRTAELAQKAGVCVLRMPENRGYGAALKAGIAAARNDTIVITDADGTYPAESIPELLDFAEEYDMVVGARTGQDVAIPWTRRPAKEVLRWLASYLAGRPIPDLNSGLRVMPRDLVRRFEHILPSGFSFTTTITLAAMCSDLLVYYHPINYYERVGDSKIRPTHALEFLILILRTIVYFNPLKVFLPAGALFFFAGLAKFVYDWFMEDLSESAVLAFIAAAMLWSLGLLADQIARTGLGGERR
jgi:glycosyltransferase involved in cell wall biosynthesis